VDEFVTMMMMMMMMMLVMRMMNDESSYVDLFKRFISQCARR